MSELERALSKIKQLESIIAKELSEDDGLGYEYIYVIILKDQIRQLQDSLSRMEFLKPEKKLYDRVISILEEALVVYSFSDQKTEALKALKHLENFRKQIK